MEKISNLWFGLHDPGLSLSETHVGIVGVPYDGSVTGEAGAAKAPALLREISEKKWSHTENLVNIKNLHLRDFGDVPVKNDDDHTTQNAVTKMVRPLVDAGVIPVVLGGDHSITSGVVSAYVSKKELGILWMDSHPDLMDTFGSLRGKKESKWNHACSLRRICEMPNVKPENVLLFGIRDLITEELEFIDANGIEVIYAKNLYTNNLDEIVNRIGKKFENVPDVYVSFDIDVLDPAFAPGTGTPEPGGISTRFLYDLIFRLFDKEKEYLENYSRHFLRIAGFDVVEIAPPLDTGNITSYTGRGIILNMLGYIALQEGIPDLNMLQ